MLLGDRAFRPVAAERVAVTWDELHARVRNDLTGDPEARLEAAADRLRAAPAGQDGAARDAYLEALHLAYAARRWPEGSLAVRIQHVRIGDLPLVALPFEVLAEFGLRVKERVPDALVIAYANGYEGYLPFQHDLAAGGYEVTADRFGPLRVRHRRADLDAVLRGLDQCFQAPAKIGKHEIYGRESLLTVDDVEHFEARMMSGFLRNHDRAEEMFLVGEVPVLRGLENLLFDVLLELIPVSRSPNVSALEERNHVTHFA